MSDRLQSRLQDHSPELLAYLRGRLSPHDAEDALQIVMLKAVEKLDTLKRESALRGWLFQIARTTIVDLVRKGGRELPDDTLDPPAKEVATGPCACATNLTARLSPAQARVIRLVDEKEYSIPEAAEALGASVGGTTVKLHRARKRLREEVEELCGATDYQTASTCSCDSKHCS